MRVPLKEAVPNAPSLASPVMESPLTVAVDSTLMGMGDVMFTVHDKVSPSTVPSSISTEPCGPDIEPVRVSPSVARVSVPA